MKTIFSAGSGHGTGFGNTCILFAAPPATGRQIGAGWTTSFAKIQMSTRNPTSMTASRGILKKSGALLAIRFRNEKIAKLIGSIADPSSRRTMVSCVNLATRPNRLHSRVLHSRFGPRHPTPVGQKRRGISSLPPPAP
jgi:hypothetical protein